MKSLKMLLYPLIAFGSIFAIGQYALNSNGNWDGQTNSFLRTSFVHVLEELARNSRPQPADLAIEKVTLRKVGDASGSFNFYKYYATIVLINHGGTLDNAQVILSGEDQKHIFVRNGDGDFNLRGGERFVIDKYEVFFDGNYNVGEIELNIEVKDGKDYFEDNNSYSVSILELPAKLEAIGVEDILEDGTMALSFEPENYALYTDEFEILISDTLKDYELDERYDEVYDGESLYGYHRTKLVEEALDDKSFRGKKLSELDAHYLKFDENPFDDQETRYVYLKAVNPDNGYFAVSNVLKFSPQKSISRGEFTKLFVEYAGMEIDDSGLYLFEDVSSEDLYGPYIQTLYNAGLLNNQEYNFGPDDIVTRADVLRIVMDHFDVDLQISDSGFAFEDINSELAIYPYISGLFAEGKGDAFDEFFDPDAPATKSYLKYLINEFT